MICITLCDLIIKCIQCEILKVRDSKIDGKLKRKLKYQNLLGEAEYK